MKALKEFHTKYEHKMAEKPGLTDPKTRGLRYKLIQEESNELLDAIEDNDLVAIADGIADLLYVTFGTALAYGLPIKEVFEEVHRSNMTKSFNKNRYGKTIKEAYSPARIEGILEKYS